MNNKDRRLDDIRHAINAQFSGVTKNLELRQNVLRQVRGETAAKKRISVGLVLAVILVLAAVTALAAVTLNAFRETRTYDNIRISDLLPEHLFLNRSVTAITDGYIRGGYQAGDDYIGPMEFGATIAYFDSDLQKKWELNDERLQGCLYDKVKDTKDAIYLGTEAQMEGDWFPSLMKISKSGEILWQYKGPETLHIRDYIVFDSGEVYCAGSISRKSAGGHTQDIGVILKLNHAGIVEWERTYEGDAINTFGALHPFGNGYVAAGHSQEGGYSAAYYMDIDGGPIGLFKFPEDIKTDNVVNFRMESNGKLIVYMRIQEEKTKETNDWPTSRIIYTYIDKSLFEPKD